MKLKLDTVRLKPNKADRAQIIPLGDCHLGYPTTNIKKLRGYIDFCLEKNVYVIGLGDYIEAGLTTSVGNSVYAQTLNPHKQVEEIISLFSPLAEKGLLLGLHGGNHEERIYKTSGINITKFMCRILGVRFFGYAMFHLFLIGKQKYVMYTCHGSSGARLSYTKVKAAIDLGRFINAEIIATGHVHETFSQKFSYYEIDTVKRQKVTKDKYIILTGHFLEYPESYAEMKNMAPSKTGAVKISLFGDKHDIHTSQ